MRTSDLIDRQALKDKLKRWDERDPYEFVEIALHAVDDAPTIDAVPMVRCGECKHHEDEEPGMVYCPKIVGAWVSENWYCADGEREVRDRINEIPAASPWHRVEEKPKEGTWCVIAKHSYLQPHNLFYDIAHYLHGTFSVYDCGFGEWFDGKPLYWMPIEPPKEDA